MMLLFELFIVKTWKNGKMPKVLLLTVAAV